MNVDSGNSARKFGRIYIKWEIQHYSLFQAKPGYRLVTPIFKVRGSRTTTWQVAVTPYLKSKYIGRFCLKLKNLDNLPRYEIIWCDRKLWLETEEGNVLKRMQAGSYCYEKNSKIEIDDFIYAPEDIFDRLIPSRSDTVYLNLQIILRHSLVENDFEVTSDIGTKSLSRDLLQLYQRRTLSDVTVRVGRMCILAHKAILLSRSPYFKRLFEKDGMENDFVANKLDYKAVDALFSYLYSGDLGFVLGIPTNSIGDCAEHFQIEEVMQYYVPDDLLLESKIDVQEITFPWEIEHFRTKIHSEFLILSSTNAAFNMTFEFSLLPKGYDDESNFVSFIAHISPAENTQKVVCIEICLSKSRNEIPIVKKATEIHVCSESLHIGNWDHHLIFKPNILKNNTLEIYIKIRVADWNSDWSITETHFMKPFTNSNAFENSYSRLSKHMDSLLQSNSSTDVTLSSNGINLPVHKCILAARSNEFFNLVKDRNSSASPRIRMDIKPEVLVSLMRYFYTGILEYKTASEIKVLCDIAEKYFIPDLKTLCSKILKGYRRTENVNFNLKKCTINN